MALTQRLDLRQSQQLVMTPQLQQAIKLLQLSNIELSDYVEHELERNPLLEREGPAGDQGGEPGTAALAGSDEPTTSVEAAPLSAESSSDQVTGSDGFVADGGLDTDSRDLYTDAGPGDLPDDVAPWGAGSQPWGAGGSTSFDEDAPDIEQSVAEPISLRSHLQEQIQADIRDPIDRAIVNRLVDYLDDNGYLTTSAAEVADELGIDQRRVEDALAKAGRLDPPGLFARNLKECLQMQLRAKDRLDPAMQALLEHLPLLAKRDFTTLSRICGVDSQDIYDMVDEIRALNPKPATVFANDPIQPVAPDILMIARPGNTWAVEINPDTLPRILVNRRYYAEVNQSLRTKEERDYLTECFASANWLVKSLHQRQITILKVATEIVLQQGAFFSRGVQHLKPLVLRDIADAIGMHESTVSRVTSNKYMATPRGVFELKYFFTSAIQGANGADAHSAESVRSRIRTLIDGEQPRSVLSDDRIVEILRADGVDIARRTVAKYREALRIPSSVQRRREKSMRV